MGADGLDPDAADRHVDHVAVGPDPGHHPSSVGAYPELAPADHQVARGRHHPVELHWPTRPSRWLPGRCRLGDGTLGCRLRRGVQGGGQPWLHEGSLLLRDRLEPLGRGDRLLVVEGLVRPLTVVVTHPRIQGRLRVGQAGERAGDVEEVRAQGAVEPFHLPVLVR
jgi:hypothetical protein